MGSYQVQEHRSDNSRATPLWLPPQLYKNEAIGLDITCPQSVVPGNITKDKGLWDKMRYA